ncbi:MAG: ASCH domain-containing protein [Spiroplasma sp.]
MKQAILLSIHPEYVKKIISGEKKFEFRKVKTRKYQPNKIFIYSTAPDSFIIAEADITEILEEHPDKIWNKTKKYAGINYHFFIEYYKNKDKAIAYRLENVREFDSPKTLNDLGIKAAPQSFIYLDNKKVKKIRK